MDGWNRWWIILFLVMANVALCMKLWIQCHDPETRRHFEGTPLGQLQAYLDREYRTDLWWR